MSLPYPNMDFTPLDTLTAEEMNHIVANIESLFGLIYPVGSIYMSATMSTPEQVASAFGGTWVAWGAGRVPVGVNTSDSSFNTVEKTGGEKTHTLTIAEMPSHTHRLNRGNYGNARAEEVSYSNGNSTQWTSVPVESTGGGQAHNNLQPYITCYMWKRTA